MCRIRPEKRGQKCNLYSGGWTCDGSNELQPGGTALLWVSATRHCFMKKKKLKKRRVWACFSPNFSLHRLRDGEVSGCFFLQHLFLNEPFVYFLLVVS